jgi:hypothetical protein
MLVFQRKSHTSAYVSISQHKSGYVAQAAQVAQKLRTTPLVFLAFERSDSDRHRWRWDEEEPPRTPVSSPQNATPPYVSIRQHTSAYVSRIRQHTSADLTLAADLSIRQHTSAYVSIRQHTSAYVSMRQHTSACVSIRQHIVYDDAAREAGGRIREDRAPFIPS